ncbi:MAG: hypothetical protein K6G84_15790 [Lachnospiraceae bacterium]|nr:hypothetical protein [Lachnospiraceae bacterium]
MKKFGVIILFTMLFNLCAAENIFADSPVRVVDGVGHEMSFDETGTLVTSGDTIFDFSGIKENIYVVKNEDTKNYEIADNKKYLVKEGTDVDLTFYRVDHRSRTYMDMPMLPSVCKIRNTTMQDRSVKAELIYEECEELDGTKILKGKQAKIKVQKVAGAITYIKITNENGALKYRVDVPVREFALGDGRYSLDIWNEDGKGNRYEDTLPFDTFIVDNTEPDKPKIEMDIDDDGLLKEKNCIIANKKMRFKAFSNDEGSGVKKYVYEFQDGTEKEGNILELENGFNGTFSVWAEDNAGNRSENAVFKKKIIVDTEKPKLNVSKSILLGEVIHLNVETDDELSGIDEVKIVLDEKEIVSNKNVETDCRIDISSLEEGVHYIKIEALDKAGNTSEKRLDLDIEKIESPIEELLMESNKAEKAEKTKIKNLPTIPELLKLDKKYIKKLFVDVPKKALDKDYTNGDIEMYINGESFYGGGIERAGHYVLSIRATDEMGRKNVSKAEFIIRKSAD